MVTSEETVALFRRMQSRASEPKVQVEVCVEVDEQAEELVRHTHARKEKGSLRHIGRVVIRFVPQGTQHGLERSEEICNRLVDAKVVNKDRKKRHADKMCSSVCIILTEFFFATQVTRTLCVIRKRRAAAGLQQHAKFFDLRDGLHGQRSVLG